MSLTGCRSRVEEDRLRLEHSLRAGPTGNTAGLSVASHRPSGSGCDNLAVRLVGNGKARKAVALMS